MFCKSVQSVLSILTLQIYKRFLYMQNFFLFFFKNELSMSAVAVFTPDAFYIRLSHGHIQFIASLISQHQPTKANKCFSTDPNHQD